MNAMTKTDGAEPIAAEPETPATPVPAKKRRKSRRLLMLALPVLLAAGGAYVWVTGGRYQETDNAYVHQVKLSIAAEAAGRVVESHVTDSTPVKAGDVLFVVDPEPYRIALEQADAALAAARLQVEQMRTAYSQAQAQASSAASEVSYLTTDLARQKDLAAKGIATRATLDTAERDLRKAVDAKAAADQAVAGALAALGGREDIPTDRHPAVLTALASRDEAAYKLAHTSVKAPADGVVSQASSFRPGQFVSAGTPLFSLVETGDGWVEANFKETQLTHMQPGQKAEIVLDTWPDHPFEATVQSIGAGTGAEFSLLPAQNATGNWVKVTQRVPVRLNLEDAGADLLLRTGMSATVSVDTGKARGLPVLSSLFGGNAEAAQ